MENHAETSRVLPRRDREGLRDLIERSAPGQYVHLVFWLLVAIANGFPARCPVIFWTVSAAMTTLFFARRRASERAMRSVEAGHKAGFEVWLLVLFMPCALWSVLAMWSVEPGPLHSAMDEFVFMVVGLATAGAVVLSIDRTVRLWYSILALLPTMVALALDGTGNHLVVSLMGFAVMLYLSAATKLVHEDYWTAIDARCSLEDRAQDLETLSTTDPLTQIANRRLFERRLQQAWSSAQYSNTSLSVLIVDLDHFKAINDTHGHGCGDDCLKATAQALREAMHRKMDIVARWGGEEFIILITDLDANEVELIAQRLRRSIELVTVAAERATVSFTCSIGVASGSPRSYANPGQLITAADRALYDAKQQGRNRVVGSRLA
jgi:diguanylate cyclase (GGDEF)-like protein